MILSNMDKTALDEHIFEEYLAEHYYTNIHTVPPTL